MWSVGCILAELLLEKPLLPGKDEADQAYRILQMFGVPTEAGKPPHCPHRLASLPCPPASATMAPPPPPPPPRPPPFFSP